MRDTIDYEPHCELHCIVKIMFFHGKKLCICCHRSFRPVILIVTSSPDILSTFRAGMEDVAAMLLCCVFLGFCGLLVAQGPMYFGRGEISANHAYLQTATKTKQPNIHTVPGIHVVTNCAPSSPF